MKKKLLNVVGARPNFVKIAPLLRCFARVPDEIETVLVHTGQHYDESMSDRFFQSLSIPTPDVNLGVGSGTHSEQAARIMMGFEPVVEAQQPDYVLTVGDVNSTLACTLVAAKMNVPAIHVEAGLRSRDRSMPEEINRVVTDALAEVLFAPSDEAKANLRAEGRPEEYIHVVGNIMIDTLVHHLEQIQNLSLISTLHLEPKKYLLLTIHRPSNVDGPKKLGRFVQEILTLAEEIPLAWPIHPRTKSRLEIFNPNLRILEPVGYIESLHLIQNAAVVITDSGGIQEETTYLRVPCLTLRENTERPETITLGTNRLTALDRLVQDVRDVLSRREVIGSIPPLWDGKTAERITEILRRI